MVSPPFTSALNPRGSTVTSLQGDDLSLMMVYHSRATQYEGENQHRSQKGLGSNTNSVFFTYSVILSEVINSHYACFPSEKKCSKQCIFPVHVVRITGMVCFT